MDEPWLRFQLGEEHYLHAVSDVREIIPYQSPNAVPGGDTENLGMLTLRGEVVTIFSARGLLSMPERAPSEESKIITLATAEAVIGVVVDNVADIVHLDPRAFERAVDGGAGSAIQGTVQHEGRLYIVVDFPSRLGR